MIAKGEESAAGKPVLPETDVRLMQVGPNGWRDWMSYQAYKKLGQCHVKCTTQTYTVHCCLKVLGFGFGFFLPTLMFPIDVASRTMEFHHAHFS